MQAIADNKADIDIVSGHRVRGARQVCYVTPKVGTRRRGTWPGAFKKSIVWVANN